MVKRISFLLGLIMAAQLLAAPTSASVPTQGFFRNADISQPRLSRDGARVVFLVRNESSRRSIAVWDVRTKKGGLVFVPNDYNVDFAFWKGDRIVFGGDVGGNESHALRSIKSDGSGLRDLSESTDRYRGAHGPVGGNVFSILPNDEEHILIAGLGTRRSRIGELQWSGEFGLYRLHVGSGRRTRVESWHDDASHYMVDDRSGSVFGRVMQSGREQIVQVKTTAGDYKVVGRYAGSDLPWAFVGLLPGEKKALLQIQSATEHDRGALYEFDRDVLQRGRLLYEPKTGEMVAIHRAPNGRILGIAREDERRVEEWFDPVWGKLHANLEATFRGRQIELVDSTDDARWHIVFVHSDRDPGTYYLYDSVTPVITKIGRVNPFIDPNHMAARQPISFSARDGLELHGYLTRPASTAGSNPLIVIPHGGPFGVRDSWTFDPEAQFLASRGYAVMQVNYRGSSGYGAQFAEAGKRQWGKAMQDDLTDAVTWAIQQGFTSVDRVGIFGASYGGYAALAGLTFTPEVYQCGANYVGVSDLTLIVRPNERTSVARDVWAEEWIGNDIDDLKRRSPFHYVAAIRVPSLHAYGENDPRVDIGHWKVLERELKKHDKPYVYIRERDEGHGFESETSRLKFYQALEKFFAEHLPVATPQKPLDTAR